MMRAFTAIIAIFSQIAGGLEPPLEFAERSTPNHDAWRWRSEKRPPSSGEQNKNYVASLIPCGRDETHTVLEALSRVWT
jgi:hypothetical protein